MEVPGGFDWRESLWGIALGSFRVEGEYFYRGTTYDDYTKRRPATQKMTIVINMKYQDTGDHNFLVALRS